MKCFNEMDVAGVVVVVVVVWRTSPHRLFEKENQ